MSAAQRAQRWVRTFFSSFYHKWTPPMVAVAVCEVVEVLRVICGDGWGRQQSIGVRQKLNPASQTPNLSGSPWVPPLGWSSCKGSRVKKCYVMPNIWGFSGWWRIPRTKCCEREWLCFHLKDAFAVASFCVCVAFRTFVHVYIIYFPHSQQTPHDAHPVQVSSRGGRHPGVVVAKCAQATRHGWWKW